MKGKCLRYPYYLDNRRKDDIIIFHYSIGSSIVPFVYEEAPRIVMVYHNITPHYYFTEINPYLYKECLAGRKWLILFKDRVEIALADSEYNRNELEELGFKNTRVLPIKIDFKKFDKDMSILLSDRYKDGKQNLLFIGRVIPNKKIEDIIEIFCAYKKFFNDSCRLFIVGGYKGYERYYYSLMRLVENMKIKDIIFTGHIPISFLSALLSVADIFLILSEHEGFCVPILEAMYRRIPVIGYESGAIPYTMRNAGILIKEKNNINVASLINEIIKNKDLRKDIIDRQMQMLREYMEYDYESELFSCLEGVLE